MKLINSSLYSLYFCPYRFKQGYIFESPWLDKIWISSDTVQQAVMRVASYLWLLHLYWLLIFNFYYLNKWQRYWKYLYAPLSVNYISFQVNILIIFFLNLFYWISLTKFFSKGGSLSLKYLLLKLPTTLFSLLPISHLFHLYYQINCIQKLNWWQPSFKYFRQ